MTRLCQVLVKLEDAPEVRLVVLLVLGVDRVQFASSTGRSEEGAVEEGGETSEGTGECVSADVEVVVRVCRGRIRIGVTVVFSQVLGGRLEGTGVRALIDTHLGVLVFLGVRLGTLSRAVSEADGRRGRSYAP